VCVLIFSVCATAKSCVLAHSLEGTVLAILNYSIQLLVVQYSEVVTSNIFRYLVSVARGGPAAESKGDKICIL